MHALVGGAGSADSCSKQVKWVGLVVQTVAHNRLSVWWVGLVVLITGYVSVVLVHVGWELSYSLNVFC